VSVVANSEVFVYASASTTQDVYTALSGSNVPGCIQAGLTKEVESTSTFPRGSVPRISVTVAPPPEAGGARAQAYAANISVQSQSGTVPAGQASIVVLASGRALVDVNTVGLFGHTFPPALAASLVTTVVSRTNSSGL
jgi:hypothetical protein